MTFEINIKPTESIFNTANANELVNLNKLDELLKSDFLQKRNLHGRNEINQLSDYRKLFNKEGIAEIPYYHSRKVDKLKDGGRVYSDNSLSMQMMRREVRHFLAHDLYIDIDMANAYPTILEQICKNNNIKCKALSSYILNREDFLRHFKCDRDNAKLLFIRLLHGGGVERWRMDFKYKGKIPPFVQKFGDEVNEIMNIFYEKNEYLNKRTSKKNTVLSWILQIYENKILEHVYTFLNDKGLIKNNIYVLCFDGIMVLKDPHINEDFMEVIKNYVFDKTGFKIDFKIKGMDPPDIKPKCLINVSDEDEDEEKYIKDGEIGLGELFCIKMGNIVKHSKINNGDYYLFDNKNKIWKIVDSSCIKNLMYKNLKPELLKVIKKYNDLENKEEDKEKKKILKNQKIYFKKILENIKKNTKLSNILNTCKYKLIDEEFEEKINIDPLYLPLKNGKKINIKSLKIEPRTNKDLFSYELDYNYKSSKNGRMEEFIRTLFDTDELYNFFKILLGYYISPERKEEIFCIWNNFKGGNGKSIIVNLIYTIFGNFICDLNPNILKQSSNINTDAELNKMYKKRIALFMESSFKGSLNFELCKKLGSIDVFQVRDCFQKGRDTKTLLTYQKPLLITQHLPTLEGDVAFLRRLLIIHFKKYFRNKGDDGYNENDKNCCKKNINLLKELKEDMDDVFSWFLEGVRDYYNLDKPIIEKVPEDFKSYKNDYVDGEDTLQEFIDENYEITNNHLDYVKCRDFLNLYNEWSDKRIDNKRMNNLMLEKGFVKGKISVMVWKFLKAKEDEYS